MMQRRVGEWGIDQAIQSIYRSFLNGHPPEDMLSDIALLVGADKAALVRIEGGPQSPGMRLIGSLHFDEAVWRRLGEPGAPEDPRGKPAHAKPMGIVGHAQTDVPNTEVAHTAFHNEINVPNDLGDILFGAIAPHGTFGASAITMYRSFSDPFFSPEDVAAMQRLMPHLQTATELAKSTRNLVLLGGEQIRSEDRFVFIVSADLLCEPISANFQELFTALGGISINNGCLTADDPSVHSALAFLADEAVRHGRGHTRVFRARSGEPCTLTCGPIPEEVRRIFFANQNSYAVFDFHLKEGARRRALRKFQASFELTEKETAILGALTQQFTLPEAATRVGMSYETARWHMRHILEKTAAQNQGELLFRFALTMSS